MSDNPYSTPQVVDIPVQPLSDAEAVRKEHLGTEASIKSIGLLYWLAAVGLGFLAAIFLTNEDVIHGPAFGALYAGLAVLYACMGFAIRKLKSWARWVGVVLTIPGLIGFPIGTIISIYFLYLLLGRRGAMVFSIPYQEIIDATPHIKYKTSKWVWIALGLLVAVTGFIVIMAAISNV